MESSRRPYIVLVIVVVLLLLIVLGVYFFSFKKGANIHNPITVFSLREVFVAEDFSEQIHPYSFGIFGLAPNSLSLASSTVLADYASVGKLKILASRDSITQNEELIELSPLKKVLPTKPGEKAGLVLSPDAQYVAYAVATSTHVHVLGSSLWELHIQKISTNQDISIAQGFDPQFFTKGGKMWLMYVSKTGLSLVDMADPTKTYITPFTLPTYAIAGLKVSPDATYLAIRDASRFKYNLFEITDLNTLYPITLKPMNNDISDLANLYFLDEKNALVTEVNPSQAGVRTISEMNISSGSRKVLYSYTGINSMRFISNK